MELRDYQKECLEIIDKLEPGAYLVTLATAMGKCFAPGTEILMYDGSVKKVEDIEENDKVMGPDSKARIVKGLTHGFDEMYEIIPKKGDSYIVNKPHILSLMCTGNNNKRIMDINGNKYGSGDICNISVEDYLKCSKTFKHCMKGYRTGIEFEEKDVELDPYIFGLWLADGTARFPQITIADKDIEIINYVKQFVRNNNLNLNIKDFCKPEKAKLYCISSKSEKHNSNPINLLLNKYGIRNNKYIPMHYLTNSRKIRLQLLAGLLDGDAFYTDGCYEIATKSETLKDNILYLARSLSLAAYSNKEKIVNGKKYYRIVIGGENIKYIPCIVERKKPGIRKSKKSALRVGIEVKAIGMGEYYGFELIGEDRRFLLADFTVVHNTVVFSQIKRKGRMLILSHRDELVHQPIKYFDCPVGIEKAKEHSNGEEVVSASVQSLVRRLDKFKPDDFDIIVTDEAHHAVAKSYKKIYDYFKPRLHLGFTATANRADGVGLRDIYQKIIYSKDTVWGIENNYLSDINCISLDVGFDLRGVKISMGDFDTSQLSEVIDTEEYNKCIANGYKTYAKGATLIFAASVSHAMHLSELIEGSKVVTGKTPEEERRQIIKDFSERKFPCLINCMVFTEGTDIPLIETVIIARPTSNQSLYTQMVGRALRLHPEKEITTLIDCVGVTGKLDICTPADLLGVDTSFFKRKQRMRFGEIRQQINAGQKCPINWSNDAKEVNLFAKQYKLDLKNINFSLLPNRDLFLNIKDYQFHITAPDALKNSKLSVVDISDKKNKKETIGEGDIQVCINNVYEILSTLCLNQRSLWDLRMIKKWGRKKITDSQIKYLFNLWRDVENKNEFTKDEKDFVEGLTKGQASMIINQLIYEKEIQEKKRN